MRAGFVLVAFVLAGAQTGRDPNTVLELARKRLQTMAHSLEKYVCVESVDRAYYERITSASAGCADASAGEPRQLSSTDRVRLEVTLSGGRELHSWPGATRFDTRDVDELIRNGPVSTGSFGGLLGGIFDNDGAVFTYKGEKPGNGKNLLEYHYSVPLAASHFDVKVEGAWKAAAFEGDFTLDPDSLDLERLTVRTTQLPSGTPFCSAASTLEYQRTHVGDSDMLLPKRSDLDIVLNNARETRNATTFSSCREYQAESEINFGNEADPASATARSGGRSWVSIPVGVPVTLALTAPIDTATAAAGDAVDAKVVKPVRRPGTNEELIPAGAIVSGRIRRVEHHLTPAPYFRIVLAFNRLAVGGRVSPFFARSEPDAELVKDLDANFRLRDAGLFYWGTGTFLFPSKKDHVVIPAGFESKWFTLDIGGR